MGKKSGKTKGTGTKTLKKSRKKIKSEDKTPEKKKKTEDKEKVEEKEKTEELPTAVYADGRVVSESSDNARDIYNQSRFGKILENGRVHFSLHESLYLIEKNKLIVVDGRNRQIDAESFLKKASRLERKFWIRYCVFKNMRDRGYIIKTALKFGADFRVYDRGIKPGEDHARWVVYPVHEGSSITWYEFAAKNRVAHSTKKRLLIGIVDDEGDVTYYEIRWMRP